MTARDYIGRYYELSALVKQANVIDSGDLNESAWRILFTVYQNDSVFGVSELADKLQVRRSVLSSQLKRLLQNGALITERSQVDRRREQVHLTDDGKELVLEGIKRTEARLQQLTKDPLQPLTDYIGN